MEDVRKAAQSRAARENRAPLGTSFESERRRSKNALVKQISSQDGRNVRMIAAAAETPEEERILRVAAYCRVSTDDIDQALSIHLQILLSLEWRFSRGRFLTPRLFGYNKT